MFGDGIVSLGVAPSTAALGTRMSSAKIVWSRWIFSVTCSAAGVNSTVARVVAELNLDCARRLREPAELEMKSMCQVARRNSPSVADCSPASF